MFVFVCVCVCVYTQIIGGSFISTGQLASKFARYQFRPHFFQHATFRVVCQEVDLSLYDTKRYGPEMPIVSVKAQMHSHRIGWLALGNQQGLGKGLYSYST